MAKEKVLPQVLVGDIWADNDKRMAGRVVRVDRIDGGFAFCVVGYIDSGGFFAAHGGRNETRIAIQRFRPTSSGYRFVRGAR